MEARRGWLAGNFFDGRGSNGFVRPVQVFQTEPCILVKETWADGYTALPAAEVLFDTPAEAWEAIAQQIDRHIHLLREQSDQARLRSVTDEREAA
jgi:hypothetical protein